MNFKLLRGVDEYDASFDWFFKLCHLLGFKNLGVHQIILKFAFCK